MSLFQALRRAAAPLKSHAARYLGGAISSDTTFDTTAALDVRLSQYSLTRTLFTETDNTVVSQAKPSADQGPSQPIPTSQQNPTSRLILQRAGDPTSVGAEVASAPFVHPGSPEKVAARISNIPKYLFKSDLLWFLKGCNLRPEDVVFTYDAKYRPKYLQVSFSSVESFRLAQRSLSMKGRLGGRYLKLTQEEPQMDDMNEFLHQFRGRSLLMQRLPYAVAMEDVERFFAGYALDNNYPVKIVRWAQEATGGRGPPALPPKTDNEVRALIRFRSDSEALRALREKQGSFLSEKAMDLRFIE